MEEIIKDVYVVNVLDDGTIVLQDRAYNVVKVVEPSSGGVQGQRLLLDGACVCRIDGQTTPLNTPQQRAAVGLRNIAGLAFWFCESKTDGSLATAKINSENDIGFTQVVLESDGCRGSSWLPERPTWDEFVQDIQEAAEREEKRGERRGEREQGALGTR